MLQIFLKQWQIGVDMQGVHTFYQQQLQAMSVELQTVSADVQGWQDEVEGLQTSLSEAQGRLAEQRREYRSVVKQRNHFESRVMELEGDLEDAEVFGPAGSTSGSIPAEEASEASTCPPQRENPVQLMAQLSETKGRLDSLARAHEVLVQEHAGTKQALLLAEEAKASLVAASAQLQKDVDSAEARDKDRRENIARLMLEDSKNKSLLDLQRDTMERSSRDSAAQAQRLADARKQLEEATAEVGALKTKLDAAGETATESESDMEAFRSAEKAKMESAMESLRKENRSLLARLKDGALTLDQVQKDKKLAAAKYEKDARQAAAEMHAIENQFRQISERHAERVDCLEDRCAGLSSELANANVRVVELETALSAKPKGMLSTERANVLHGENQRLQNEMSKLQSCKRDSDEQLLIAEASIENLQRELADYKALRGELDSALVQVAAMRAESSDVEKAREDVEKMTSEANKALATKEADIRQRLAALEAEEERCKLLSVRETTSSMQLRRAISRIRELNAYNAALETEVATSVVNLDSSNRAQIIAIRHMFSLHQRDESRFSAMLEAIKYELQVTCGRAETDTREFIDKLRTQCMRYASELIEESPDTLRVAPADRTHGSWTKLVESAAVASTLGTK